MFHIQKKSRPFRDDFSLLSFCSYTIFNKKSYSNPNIIWLIMIIISTDGNPNTFRSISVMGLIGIMSNGFMLHFRDNRLWITSNSLSIL